MEQATELFVYGTLMRGERHHDTMAGAEYLGPAQTAPHFTLVQIDYYPALLRGGSSAIRGELYRVQDATLARLDELEEVPHYYVRERITLADGRSVDTYVLPRERLTEFAAIPSGCFRTHRPQQDNAQ